jgi:hypothetical protein
MNAALIVSLLAMPPSAALAAAPAGVHEQRLDVNRVGTFVSNSGPIALDVRTFDGGLEYPRGSGVLRLFDVGLWLGAKAPELRMAVSEFRSDFEPGPWVTPARADSVIGDVFEVTRDDPSGWSDWVTRAAATGAPVVPSGTAPAFLGDQMIWTVMTDADANGGPFFGQPRPTAPLGAEVALLAWAFDRPGSGLDDAVFLRWRIVNRSATAWDSAYVGIWSDHLPGPPLVYPGSDTLRDLYVTTREVTAESTPDQASAAGVLLLRGPRVAADTLGMTSYVWWVNGADPRPGPEQWNVLRGLDIRGNVIQTPDGDPTTFMSSGDPLTGTGWIQPDPRHAHMVMGSGPFTLAPGDTQVVEAALVFGRDPSGDPIESLIDLRAHADSVRASWRSGFASVPAPVPRPIPVVLDVAPNPAFGGMRLSVPGGRADGPVTIDVHDLQGRAVRTLTASSNGHGVWQADWDGLDDSGHRCPNGIYLAVGRVAGLAFRGRIALIRR